MLGRLSIVAIALVVCGCNDEKDPVDVPFEGLEVPGGEDNDTKKPPPATEPTATETSAPSPVPAPRPTASRVGSCCAALRSASLSSRDEGGRKMYDQAAKVCSGLMGEVTRGKLTEGQALSQVRSSLLGPAPSACR